MSCIDPSVQIVKKSLKEKPLLIFSISLVLTYRYGVDIGQYRQEGSIISFVPPILPLGKQEGFGPR
jgi:hypothetical protein